MSYFCLIFTVAWWTETSMCKKRAKKWEIRKWVISFKAQYKDFYVTDTVRSRRFYHFASISHHNGFAIKRSTYAKHLQGGSSESGEDHELPTSAGQWAQSIFIWVLKTSFYIMILVCWNTLKPLKYNIFSVKLMLKVCTSQLHYFIKEAKWLKNKKQCHFPETSGPNWSSYAYKIKPQLSNRLRILLLNNIEKCQVCGWSNIQSCS